MTTHIVALSREQVASLADQFVACRDTEQVQTLFFISTDDPLLTNWFHQQEGLFGEFELPQGLDEPDSVFMGEVFTLGITEEVTSDLLRGAGFT